MLALGLVMASPAAVTQDEIRLPEGPDRDLVYGNCRTCHDLQYVMDSKGMTRHMWDGLLGTMEEFGLDLDEQQRARILDYLATYLGPNPPAAPAPTSAQGAGGAVAADGGAIFASQCVACHQPDGRGRPGEFPPLAGNPDLFRTRDFPLLVLLYGLQGKIEVGGNTFDGIMPPFAHLSDAEIAALVNHVRGAWGNDEHRPADMPPVTAGDVSRVRAKSLSSREVHEYRARN